MLPEVLSIIFSFIDDPVTFFRVLCCSKQFNAIASALTEEKQKQFIVYVNDSLEKYYAFPNGLKHGPYQKWTKEYSYGTMDDGSDYLVSRVYGMGTPRWVLVVECEYKMGKWHGQRKCWNYDGTISSNGTYRDGIAVGKHILYDKFGLVLRHFDMGPGKKKN